MNFMKKIILILFATFCTNTFAQMYQKTQGNSGALPANNAVTPTAQSIVINVNPNSIYTSGSAALSITGAQGTPTYSVTSGSCTISGSTITAGSSAGTCVIQASIPASTYFLASSASTSITINALQAQSISVSSNSSSIFTGGNATVSTSGAQGAVTYSVTSGSCTISGTTVTAGSSAGTCVIRANAAATASYLAGSATVSITVNALQNQTLTTVANPSSFNPSGNSTLSTTGAQGSVSYSVQSGSCSVSGTTVTASAAGTCVIRANAAATTGYLAGTATVTLTVTPPAATADYTDGDWAYFNATISINNSNLAVAQTKCSTLGAGWRLPYESETWGGGNGWGPPISAIWNVAYPSNGQTKQYILNNGGYTGHWFQQNQVRAIESGAFNQYFSSTSYTASKIFCKRG